MSFAFTLPVRSHPNASSYTLHSVLLQSLRESHSSYYYKNTNQEVEKKDFVVDNIKEEKNDYMIKINYNGKIEEIELEEYVVGVVSCEMPASFDYEALKSMAVAARTYALYKVNNKKGYVMKTTAVDQCYIDVDKMKTKWGSSFDKMYNKVKSAVNDTKYEYMTYKDDIIISFYFSISNGYTENCENVFSQKLDYLKSVSSEWDKDYNYKEKEVKYSIKDFLNKLSLTGNKIENISIDRTSTNRVTTININGNCKIAVKIINKKVSSDVNLILSSHTIIDIIL